MGQHGDLPDPKTVAAEHIAAYRALPVKRAKHIWPLRREFARSLKKAPPEFVLQVARDLFYNQDNPGHANSLLMFHKETFQTLGEAEIEEYRETKESEFEEPPPQWRIIIPDDVTAGPSSR